MKYALCGHGLVHLISAISGEFTLCGDAFDGGVDTELADQPPWEPCKRGPVTCEKCAAEIANCRGVRIARIEQGAT